MWEWDLASGWSLRRGWRRVIESAGAGLDDEVLVVRRHGLGGGRTIDAFLPVGLRLVGVAKRAVIVDDLHAIAPDVDAAVAIRVELDVHLHRVPVAANDVLAIV